uniref:Glycosyltransferase n=1 Tax=Bupleurum chinense TaxID=52451 RepID=I3VI29_BUPCH|nr:glycosyltransferase UGT3 [Bupleurum chinense]
MGNEGALKIYMLPCLMSSHLVPLCEIGHLFSSTGQNVTILTTPHNASLIKNATTTPNFRVQTFPFPAEKVGLPEGVENFLTVSDIPTARKMYTAMSLLQTDIERFIVSNPPDCIVSDMFFPWTADLAVRIGVPRIVFQATCIFAQTLKDAVRRSDSPHRSVTDDYEPFVIPNLPHKITMTRSQLPDYVRSPNGYTQLIEQWREAELKSYGIIVNNFVEIESEYTDYYKKVMDDKIKIYHVGPVSLIHTSDNDKGERGPKTAVGENECLSWLNDKKLNSVLYVCFGSSCSTFPDAQLMEIACGLDASGCDFIWVVFGRDNESDDDMIKWTPPGFMERVIKTKRGMIIKGWAPQVLILDHPSVGGFLSHCGWNSVIESLSCGVPMATWPLYAEHFYNEKLLTQVLGVGIEVGAEDWNLWVDSGKKVVEREKIEKAVRKLMEGEDDVGKEMRNKTRELGEMAKNAVKEGGSSYKNLRILIEELKEIRDNK